MRTAVIVALVFAVGLAFATFFVMRRPAAATPAPVAWLAGLSDSTIDAIRLSWGDKADDLRIVSDGGAGWIMERSTPGGGVAKWPVQAAQVRGGLRLLSDLAKLTHSDTAVMRNAATTLIVFSKDGRDIGSIRLAIKGLGGQAPAIIGDAPPRFVYVEEALSRAFLREGVLQWRTAMAFPGMTTTAQRVAISNPVAKVELVRSSGVWNVNEPIRTPASATAMKQLLTTLASVPISKFADDAESDDSKLGLSSPIASIRVETPLPGSEGTTSRRALVERLEVGGPADVARTTIFVRIVATIETADGMAKPAWGPIVAVAERSRLDQIAGDASVYASKAVWRESAADVVGLRLADAKGGSIAFLRTIDGWFVLDEAGKPSVKVESERAKAIQHLIEVQCTERASRVRDDAVQDLIVMTTVEARVADGPLPSTDVVLCAINSKACVGLRTKGVLRLYEDADERSIQETVRVIWEK